jgi:hypothetical protein
VLFQHLADFVAIVSAIPNQELSLC